jgi:hypothetical protein
VCRDFSFSGRHWKNKPYRNPQANHTAVQQKPFSR